MNKLSIILLLSTGLVFSAAQASQQMSSRGQNAGSSTVEKSETQTDLESLFNPLSTNDLQIVPLLQENAITQANQASVVNLASSTLPIVSTTNSEPLVRINTAKMAKALVTFTQFVKGGSQQLALFCKNEKTQQTLMLLAKTVKDAGLAVAAIDLANDHDWYTRINKSAAERAFQTAIESAQQGSSVYSPALKNLTANQLYSITAHLYINTHSSRDNNYENNLKLLTTKSSEYYKYDGSVLSIEDLKKIARNQANHSDYYSMNDRLKALKELQTTQTTNMPAPIYQSIAQPSKLEYLLSKTFGLEFLLSGPEAYFDRDLPLETKLKNALSVRKIITILGTMYQQRVSGKNAPFILAANIISPVAGTLVWHVLLKELPDLYKRRGAIAQDIQGYINPKRLRALASFSDRPALPAPAPAQAHDEELLIDFDEPITKTSDV